MDRERDIARGIQRQKVAQTRANMAGVGGCGLTLAILTVVIGASGLFGLWLIGFALLASMVVGGVFYQRVLSRNLNG